MEEGMMTEGPALASYISGSLGRDISDIRTYSPLTLAYIGDAVYDLWIRTYIVAGGQVSPDKLHKRATKYVSAVAQAKIVTAIEKELTEDEADMLRRGRNAKPHTTAKNASVADYHTATGLECLIGYLYLKGDTDRITRIIGEGIKAIGK